jgi:hypothetical protein
MQKQTHEKINKLETQIDRIERILIGLGGWHFFKCREWL